MEQRPTYNALPLSHPLSLFSTVIVTFYDVYSEVSVLVLLFLFKLTNRLDSVDIVCLH